MRMYTVAAELFVRTVNLSILGHLLRRSMQRAYRQEIGGRHTLSTKLKNVSAVSAAGMPLAESFCSISPSAASYLPWECVGFNTLPQHAELRRTTSELTTCRAFHSKKIHSRVSLLEVFPVLSDRNVVAAPPPNGPRRQSGLVYCIRPRGDASSDTINRVHREKTP